MEKVSYLCLMKGFSFSKKVTIKSFQIKFWLFYVRIEARILVIHMQTCKVKKVQHEIKP